MMSAHSNVVNTFENTQTFTPLKVINVSSVEELSNEVADAVASGHRIRTLGAGESWAQHATTKGISINSLGLNRIHNIDTVKKTIDTDAGVRLGQVSRALAEHGLTLPSLPFNPRVTIGGAVATATHGTSAKWGTVSDSVLSMDIVTASGEVKRIDEQARPEEMMAARTAIGMLGVITRLEIQAIDIPWVQYSELNMDLATFRALVSHLVAHYAHIWAHWTFGSDKVRIDCLQIGPEQAPGFHRYGVIDQQLWKPPSDVKMDRWQSLMVRGEERLRRFRGQVWMSMQYGVSLSQIDNTIEMIKNSAFYSANRGRNLEFKFLKGNHLAYLGPNTDGDAVLLNLWWLADWDKRFKTFQTFENMMRTVYARPHWGKAHKNVDPEYMHLAYPDWDKFECVRKEYDPEAVFSIFG